MKIPSFNQGPLVSEMSFKMPFLCFYLRILGSLFIFIFYFFCGGWGSSWKIYTKILLLTTFFTNDLELNRLRETFFLWGNVPSYQEKWLKHFSRQRKQLQCHQSFWCFTSLFLLIIVQISNQLTIKITIDQKILKGAQLHEVDILIWNIL